MPRAARRGLWAVGCGLRVPPRLFSATHVNGCTVGAAQRVVRCTVIVWLLCVWLLGVRHVGCHGGKSTQDPSSR